jgi:hypothetical protein
MHRSKVPLTKWFLAAFLMGQSKRGISALELSKQLSLRYETAWLLCRRLRAAMQQRDRRYFLFGTVEMDDAYVGGVQPGKVGRGTTKAKTVVAVGVDEHGLPSFAKVVVVPDFTQATVTEAVKSMVAPGARIINGRAWCFRWSRRSRIRPSASPEPQLAGRGRAVSLRAHPDLQPQGLDRRHVPRARTQVPTSIHQRVLLPLQPAAHGAPLGGRSPQSLHGCPTTGGGLLTQPDSQVHEWQVPARSPLHVVATAVPDPMSVASSSTCTRPPSTSASCSATSGPWRPCNRPSPHSATPPTASPPPRTSSSAPSRPPRHPDTPSPPPRATPYRGTAPPTPCPFLSPVACRYHEPFHTPLARANPVHIA